MVDVIRWMYKDFQLNFSVGKASELIPYSIGIHQGDNLAPLLLNLFFQAALESLELVRKQAQIPGPLFKWFPTSKNSWINGHLRKQ
eukprot:2895109-Ditylum_brightwellii.AAC.1